MEPVNGRLHSNGRSAKHGINIYCSRPKVVAIGSAAAAVIPTLIQKPSLNNVDPQAWANVLARINDHDIHSLDQPLRWNWKARPARLAV